MVRGWLGRAVRACLIWGGFGGSDVYGIGEVKESWDAVSGLAAEIPKRTFGINAGGG